MKNIFQDIKILLAFPKKLLLFLMRGIFVLAKFIFSLPKNIWKIAKKIAHIARNPKLILTSFLLAFRNLKRFLKRLPKQIREYFFWLIMSPQGNVWRLERKKIHDIPTVSEIKEYQKHLRKKTFGVVFTSAMAVMLIFAIPGLFQKYFAHSKTYQWVQVDWSSGVSAATTGALSGWTYISGITPAPKAIDVGASGPSGTGTPGQIALHQYTQQTVQENGGASPYSGAATATGQGVGVTGGIVELKKLLGWPCTLPVDCISNTCTANVCAKNVTTYSNTSGNVTLASGATNLVIDASGSAGSASLNGIIGGQGGLVHTTLVSGIAGQTFNIFAGTYGTGGAGSGGYGVGGKASAVVRSYDSAILAVAGGGGGGGATGSVSGSGSTGAGGSGGCANTSGLPGGLSSGQYSQAYGGSAGGGATLTTFGGGGPGGYGAASGSTGNPGNSTNGGAGATNNTVGGGGGAGFFGGGGGGGGGYTSYLNTAYGGAGGGGGGSSYCNPLGSCSPAAVSCANSSATGSVTITWW